MRGRPKLRAMAPIGVVVLTLATCAAVFWFLYTEDPTKSAFMQLGIVAAISTAVTWAWRTAERGGSRNAITVLGVVWVLLGGVGLYGAIDSFLHPSQAVGFGNPTEGETGNDLLTWLVMLSFAAYGAAAVALYLVAHLTWKRLRGHRSPARSPQP